MQGSGFVKLTRKSSLITAAAALPKAISDVKEAMLVPGYITNITNDACYVRFLGQLTGRAGLAQLADLFVSDPSRHFHVGQSVRAQVVQVRERNRKEGKVYAIIRHNGSLCTQRQLKCEIAHVCETIGTL